MTLRYTPHIENKLITKHQVTIDEVKQCISNLDPEKDHFFEDTAEKHATNPPSFWFISETDMGRKLKVVIIPKDDFFQLKTAFDAKPKHIALYEQLLNDL